jgi:hypothetical protein
MSSRENALTLVSASEHAVAFSRPSEAEVSATLADLSDLSRADSIGEVIISAVTGLQYLHTRGVVHSNLAPENVIQLADRRWLLDASPASPSESFSDAALDDATALIEMLIRVYCIRTVNDIPLLRPSIRAALGYRESARYETLLSWAWFRTQERSPAQRTRERIAYFLDRLKDHASTDVESDEPGGDATLLGGWYDLPYDWRIIVDRFWHLVENESVAQHGAEELASSDGPERLIALGIDGYWRTYIQELVDQRLAAVHAAQERESEGVADEDDIDAVIDHEILLAYAEEGEPTREALLGELIEEANRVRETVLQPGVVSLEDARHVLELGGQEMNDEELFALLRGGNVIAVIDHGELRFPKFQFSSVGARRTVARVSRQQRASFPSWLWTSRWFIPLDEYGGRTAAQMIEEGRGDELFNVGALRDRDDAPESSLL